MSKDTFCLAEAINLPEIAQHPNEAMAALVEVVRRQGSEIELLQENQAILFGIIAKLKDRVEPEPQPAQQDRGEILRAILIANGGKMFAKDARQQMRLPKNLFSMLLKSQTDSIKVRPFHLDHRRLVLEII
jgi:hypothetical protein